MRKDIKDNCFTLVRYIMAVTVVMWHARRDLGINDFFFKKFTCVPVFFFISAFLAMYSLDKKEISFKDYIKNRFRRIYPELWISVLLCAIVIAVQFPYVLKSIQYYLWLFAQSTFFQFWTPDLLRFYGNGTPNGALWTIIVTIQFYVIVYFLHKRFKKIPLWLDVLIVIAGILLNSLISFAEIYCSEIVYKLIWQTILPYTYMFYMGIVFYKYFDKLKHYLTKYFYVVLLIYVIYCFNSSIFNYIIPYTSNTSQPFFVLANLVFWFAFAYKFNNIKIKKDYSYGMFVFHMVYLNYFVENGLVVNNYVTLIVVIILTIITAVLSDLLINKLLKN